ncbi:MAG: ribonuclease D [Alphaproteobacteria bacterium]|nr:ribonuclease D [Alphaproteobacteria bacterium]
MIITTSQGVADFCRSLSQNSFITVDTEFLREKTYYPKLCLVQLSGPDKDARAIDPLIKGIDLSPLYDLLADTRILKVFHAARQDLEIFYNLTGKVASPVFDTQIAAMVCGYGDSVGYNNLVHDITGKGIDKSAQFMDWSHRPLTERQIDYALGDVTHLCDVYVHLAKKLEHQNRVSWVLQEEEILNNPSTYSNDPYEAWKRIKLRSPSRKTLAVLREVAAWREKAAQERDIPKSWMMRDETLADLASQAPRTVEELQKIRNMPKDHANGRIGEALLDAIRKALSAPKDEWPQVEKRKSMPPQAAATLDILKMLLKIQSSEHGVAAKLIATQDDLEAIVMDDEADVPALKGWRREVFGEDALALKAGRLAIGLSGDRITKFPVSSLQDPL